MKNRMLPKEEIVLMGRVIKDFDDLVQYHKRSSVSTENTTDLEQIHTVVYMDLLKDLSDKVYAMRDLLEIPEEEFTKLMTKDGKVSLEEVKRILIKKMILDMITD